MGQAWNSGSADDRYQLRREAALFIRRNSPEALPVPRNDGGGGDEIDLVLRNAEREMAQARAKRQQARFVQTRTSLMVENWVFTHTTNAMSFAPVSW